MTILGGMGEGKKNQDLHVASLALQATSPRLLVAPSKHRWLPTRDTGGRCLVVRLSLVHLLQFNSARRKKHESRLSWRNGQIRTESHCAGPREARDGRGHETGGAVFYHSLSWRLTA